MINPIDLKWGETPFDFMTREEMLDTLRAQYLALKAASGALHNLEHFYRQLEPSHPYWSSDGTGGRAKRLVERSIERIVGPGDTGERSESIFRSYFRYAEQIHFPNDVREKDIWWINSDDEMVAGNGMPQGNFREGGATDWRMVTADDLKPKDTVDE